jgi:2-methylcitrate dehydratase PrpD
MRNTSKEPSLTEQLSAFLVATQSTDIPDSVINAAKYFALDWLGSAIAGTQTKQGQILLAYAAAQEGRGATVIGLGGERNADLAALTNGGLSHIVEMDDLHRASVVHPAAPIIPAALAVAEREGTSGLDFLTAVVLGYEVAIRIGEAVGRSHYRFWHNTATCGVFGAAAAAGWLLGLDAEQMVWALGNAGTMAAGLWEFIADGAMSKHLHAGRAASSGLLAADLARRGFTGARCILEGERGFFAATSSDARPELITQGLPCGIENSHSFQDNRIGFIPQGLAPGMADYKITGVSIKPYPSCRHTHPAIDAALALRREHDLLLEHIEEVKVATYQAALALTDNPSPTHPYAAKFSLQYCVACALAHGRVGLDEFEPEALEDETVHRLMAKISVGLSEELDSHYPQEWPARVRVTLDDGREFAQLVEVPKGDPENPLTQAELEEKFRLLIARTGYGEMADVLIERVNRLERLEKARQLLTPLRRAFSGEEL